MEKNYFTHIVSLEEEGYSIDTLLRRRLNFSRGLVRQLKTADNVLLNGAPALLREFVKAGDLLSVNVRLEESPRLPGEPMPLEICYEDEDLLVINKPSGMAVHTTPHHQTGTLANGVIYYWQSKGLNNHFRPVNRLDRDTSGLVIIAANSFSHQQLALQQAAKNLHREYIAVIHGRMPAGEGAIAEPIDRKPGSIVERMVHPCGKLAVTHYRVQEELPGAAILKIWLETGRTHQIRVHLSHLGRPLLGDSLYGEASPYINRQALHAAKTIFIQPRTKTKIKVEAPLPPDMVELVTKLKGRI